MATRKVSTASLLIAEQLEAEMVTKSAIALHPNDPKAQIVYFFQRFRIPAAKGRARSVSKLTTVKYLSTLECFIAELRSKGTKPKSIDSFTARQLVAAMRGWESQSKSSSTLANRFSIISRFLVWQKVNVPYKSVHDVLVDKDNGKRCTSVTQSKAWSAHGVSLEEVLAKVEQFDKIAALQLQLAAAFGLRVQEACALKPIESDQGQYLIIHLGAKGGRGRTVKIETAFQRASLDKAKAFAITSAGNGFVRKRGQTIKSAINRFYYCLKLAGVNKKELGISAHGLRHEYANDLYASRTGQDAPVNFGSKVDKQLEYSARREVTEALGHSRLSITSAYLGSHKMMDRVAMKRLHALNVSLTDPQSQLTAEYWKLQGFISSQDAQSEIRVFLTGLSAEGKELNGAPLLLSAGIFSSHGLPSSIVLSPDQLISLGNAANQITSSWCVCVLDSTVPTEIERFELIFLNPS